MSVTHRKDKPDNTEELKREIGEVKQAGDGTAALLSMTFKAQIMQDRAAGTNVITDDMIDTGGTIVGACACLKEAGAKSVTIVATHALFNGDAVKNLKECGAREVIVTDTVPVPEEKRFDNLTVLSIAPLLADAMKAIFSDGSVAGLFQNYDHSGQKYLKA